MGSFVASAILRADASQAQAEVGKLNAKLNELKGAGSRLGQAFNNSGSWGINRLATDLGRVGAAAAAAQTAVAGVGAVRVNDSGLSRMEQQLNRVTAAATAANTATQQLGIMRHAPASAFDARARENEAFRREAAQRMVNVDVPHASSTRSAPAAKPTASVASETPSNAIFATGNKLFAATMGYFGVKSVLKEGYKAADAEAQFRMLTEGASNQQKLDVLQLLRDQSKTGRASYGELALAGAEAAQIMGTENLDKVPAITALAQKLNMVDKKISVDLAAQKLAAYSTSEGVVDLNKAVIFADKMTALQNAGAAKPMDTMLGFRRVQPFSKAMGIDDDTVLSLMAAQKNANPMKSEQEIGTEAQYALRMMRMPTQIDRKSLAELGISDDMRKDPFAVHRHLRKLADEDGGRERIEKGFSGRNVMAGRFWLSMLSVSEAELQRQVRALQTAAGAADRAAAERMAGMAGAFDRLQNAANNAKSAITKAFEVPLAGIADKLSSVLQSSSDAVLDWGKGLTSIGRMVKSLGDATGISRLSSAMGDLLGNAAGPAAAAAAGVGIVALTAKLARLAGLASPMGKLALALGGVIGVTADGGKLFTDLDNKLNDRKDEKGAPIKNESWLGKWIERGLEPEWMTRLRRKVGDWSIDPSDLPANDREFARARGMMSEQGRADADRIKREWEKGNAGPNDALPPPKPHFPAPTHPFQEPPIDPFVFPMEGGSRLPSAADGISTALSEAGETIQTSGSNVSSGIQSAGDAVVSAINGLASQISQAMAAIGNAASSAVGSVTRSPGPTGTQQAGPASQ